MTKQLMDIQGMLQKLKKEAIKDMKRRREKEKKRKKRGNLLPEEAEIYSTVIPVLKK